MTSHSSSVPSKNPCNPLHEKLDKIDDWHGRSIVVLDKGMSIPIVGTAISAFKLVLGFIQVVVGTALGGLAAIATPFAANAKNLSTWSFKHVKYGLKNFSMALVQGIPLVGTVIYFNQKKKDPNASVQQDTVKDHRD